MTVSDLISMLLLIASCHADLQTDCSAINDTYYKDGICYVAEQYDSRDSISCQSLNSEGKLIDVHTADALVNISTMLYNPQKKGINVPHTYLNGYKLKVGDEIRIVGRYQPGLTDVPLYFINSEINDFIVNLQIKLALHEVKCWAKIGGTMILYDTGTVDASHIRNDVGQHEFDIKLKITEDSYEFYFDDKLIHTCAQNQSYEDIDKITLGSGLPQGKGTIVDLITINSNIYGGQKFFWSGLSKQNAKWLWENSGLALSTNYAWTDGHPTEESDKKCALIDGNTRRLLTANCMQKAAAICQYSELLGIDPRYRFSQDVKDKKGSASSFLAEFTTKSSIVCLVKCGEVNTCKSVSYNEDNGHCELHDIHSGEEIVEALGYEIYNKV